MLARSRDRLATGNKGNGNMLTSEEPVGKVAGPNGPKLSDGGRKSKELGADATPPFAGARC